MLKLRSTAGFLACGLLGAGLLAGCGDDDDDDTGAGSPTDDAVNEEWEPTYVDGVLQPLPDGFPSDPIVLVNGDEPGHDDGLYARAIQAALDGISPVNIEVRDQSYPQFGTWVALQYMEDQSGGADGYYAQVTAFSGAAMDMLTEPVQDELGVSLDSISSIIATESTPFVMVTRADAPWQTFDEMVAAAKAEPETLRYVAATGSRLDIDTRRVMKHGDWTANTIPTGSSSEAATVVGAGEGDFTMLTPSVARAHEEAGTVRVILVTSNEEQPPAQWSDATTTAAIGMAPEAWGSIRGFSVPSSVPEAHQEWLFELFRTATEQQAHADRVASVPGAESIVIDGDELDEAMRDVVVNNEAIIRELGLHFDQQ